VRLNRFAFVLLAAYFVLIGGSPYYAQVLPIRVFHHLFATVLLVLWLIQRARRGGFPVTPINLLLYGVICVWLISAFLGINPRTALENSWFPLTHVVIFFLMVDLISTGRQALIMETYFLLSALVVLLAGVQLLSWYFGWGIVPGTDIGWADVIGTGAWMPLETPNLYLPFGVSTWLAAYAAPSALVAFVWSLTARRRDYRFVLRGLAFALAGILLLTFSRGGFIAFAAAVGLFTVLRSAGRVNIRRLTVVIPLVAVGVIILAVSLVTLTRFAPRIAGDQLRFELWRSATEIAQDYPILGVGTGLFGRAFRAYRAPGPIDDRLGTAHNAYLNVAAENGVAGLLIMVAVGVIVARTWWRMRRNTNAWRQIRLDGIFAALVGMGIQSLFDTLITPPLALLTLLLIAYLLAHPGSRLDTPPRQHAWAAAILAVLLGIYGAGLLLTDRAYTHFRQSLDGDLEQARIAESLDPHLNLYDLQIAYLLGVNALNEPTQDASAALTAYETALTLEPTWDTGWINYAALMEMQGDREGAIRALRRALDMNNLKTATIHWARLAEGSAPSEDVIHANILYLAIGDLPLSPFWSQSPLRLEAIQQFIRLEPVWLDLRYRIAAVYDPEYAASLVPDTPTDDRGWWVKGEYTLAVLNDPQSALSYFDQAIALNSTVGDYHASRARALLTSDPIEAQRSLLIAELLGTVYEYPNRIRIALATSADEIAHLRASSIPFRVIAQNFEGVLYQGRTAMFDLAPMMRAPSLGRSVLQPWVDLMQAYRVAGNIEAADNVLWALLDQAPEDRAYFESLARSGSE